VLTWVDFAKQKICIFDSIPGLASSYWAEPVRHEDQRAADAARNTARYAALSDDLETIIEEAQLPSNDTGLPAPHEIVTAAEVTAPPPKIRSQILDTVTGQASVSQILQTRELWQSGTATKSERVVKIQSKYSLSRVEQETDPVDTANNSKSKMSLKEGAHRLRVLQELNPDLKKQEQQRIRQIRWQTAVHGLKEVIPTLDDSESRFRLHVQKAHSKSCSIASSF
jgi:hypothetical protein